MSSIINVMEKSSISKIHFPDVVDGKINTEEFLHAACELVKIIEKFGNLFAPVKYDMNNNIKKLNNKYSLDKEKHSSLQDMILLEKEKGETIIALDALIWLTRSLYMILLFLEKIIKDHNAGRETEDLGAFLAEAYKDSLEPHHGWMIKQLFSLLSRSILSRSQLLQTIKGDENVTNEILLQDMDIYLKTVRSNVEALQIFYQNNKLEI